MVYKIRRKSDKLFSNGGTKPKFDLVGRYWKTETYLRNHIYGVKEGVYLDCEIVPVEIIETMMFEPISITKYKDQGFIKWKTTNGKIRNILDEMKKYPIWI